MLSTMVLMGINRIVVTDGRIHTTSTQVHSPVSEQAMPENASELETKAESERSARRSVRVVSSGLRGSVRTSVVFIATQR